ncbi:AcrR family transcriptional regulator [Nonomuraea thailandensis]|uniref:AcrR family transcriptional regulator n=1 Tax=Nonomuraea thailandensis TaxID=1188745 RepID=A0A9X2K8Q3_9ACTN|nr:TetR family transcriptional regulator [Nonomuraea thailandensis]MCP2364373.1 AcrR family transcriptional regulator [Nonomuraea thailandensis]
MSQQKRAGGRRPGASRTREEILQAAQRSFAESGYDGTTIRGVARAAGVDPALVVQFFGSKDGLFDAALRADPPMRDLVTLAGEGEAADLGARLARRYLELWEDPHTGPRMLAVVRAATAAPSASAMVTAFMTDAVMLPLARAIEADEPELRAALTGAYLLGVATARYVLRIGPLASLPRQDAASILAPVVQHHLTGPLRDPAVQRR